MSEGDADQPLASRCSVNNEKIKRLTDWRQRMALESGLGGLEGA